MEVEEEVVAQCGEVVVVMVEDIMEEEAVTDHLEGLIGEDTEGEVEAIHLIERAV